VPSTPPSTQPRLVPLCRVCCATHCFVSLCLVPCPAHQQPTNRLKDFGPNRLTPADKPGFLARLWAQLNNILIYILLAAAIVEGALQSWAEFGLVMGVIVVNTAIGLIQEGKAEKVWCRVCRVCVNSWNCSMQAKTKGSARIIQEVQAGRRPVRKCVCGECQERRLC
jgi:hypothetical protein